MKHLKYFKESINEDIVFIKYLMQDVIDEYDMHDYSGEDENPTEIGTHYAIVKWVDTSHSQIIRVAITITNTNIERSKILNEIKNSPIFINFIKRLESSGYVTKYDSDYEINGHIVYNISI